MMAMEQPTTPTTEETSPMAPTTTIRVPSKPSVAGHRISAKAVVEAAAILGLSDPIEIKWSSGRRRLGAHRYRDGRHVVTVTRLYREAASISETIWHELTHAQQTEKAGRAKFISEYRLENRRVGYQNNRFEVEARAVGANMKEQLPLTVGAAPVRVAPVPPVSGGSASGGSVVGTGQRIAVQRKNRRGHIVQVIDGSLDAQWGTQGGRWITLNVSTGEHIRCSGKRDAKAAIAAM